MPADDEPTPKPVSSGGYAVQVASAGSESEARQTASRSATSCPARSAAAARRS